MFFVFLLIQAVIIGWFCSYVAGQKNRDKGSWFLLGFLFSFLALIALAAIPAIEEKPTFVADDEDVNRKCPFCAEMVKREAIFCRFCQHDLPPVEAKSYAEKIANGANVSSSTDELPIAKEKQVAAEKNLQEVNEKSQAAYFNAIRASLDDSAGKLINAFDIHGRTPLMNAIQRKDIKSIKALLVAGAKTNQLWKDPKNGDYVPVKELAKRAGLEIHKLFS